MKKKEILKEEDTYRCFLGDYVYYLLENVQELKEGWEKSRGTSDEPFYEGQLQSFQWAISLLRQYVEAFGIPLADIGLDKIVPNKDLV